LNPLPFFHDTPLRTGFNGAIAYSDAMEGLCKFLFGTSGRIRSAPVIGLSSSMNDLAMKIRDAVPADASAACRLMRRRRLHGDLRNDESALSID
jgi:hypothetical protein